MVLMSRVWCWSWGRVYVVQSGSKKSGGKKGAKKP